MNKKVSKYCKLGKLVDARCTELGWTHKYLASKLDVSASFLSRIILGKVKPSRELAARINYRLGLAQDEMYPPPYQVGRIEKPIELQTGVLDNLADESAPYTTLHLAGSVAIVAAVVIGLGIVLWNA